MEEEEKIEIVKYLRNEEERFYKISTTSLQEIISSIERMCFSHYTAHVEINVMKEKISKKVYQSSRHTSLLR